MRKIKKGKISEGGNFGRERDLVSVCEKVEGEREGERRGSPLILVQRFTTAERLQRARRR